MTRPTHRLSVPAAALAVVVLYSRADVRQGQAYGAPSPARPAVAPTATLPGNRPPDAAAGLAIFAEHCAGCHGTYGQGDGPMVERLPAPPPDFTDPTVARRLDPAAAFRVITDGRLDRFMPPFRDSLSQEQRWDAAAAVLAMYLTPERLARSESDFQQLCASCHVAGGAPTLGRTGVLPDVAVVDGSLRDAPHIDMWRDAVDAARVQAAVDFARSLAFVPIPHESLRLDGTLRGTVRIQPMGSGLAHAAVRVIPFALGFPGDVITVTSSAAGEFAATGLVSGPGVDTLLATTYKSVDYTTVVTEVLAAGHLELAVYETTDRAPLRATAARVLLSAQQSPGILQAVEIWDVSNPTTRTLTAATGESTLAFTLPSGATAARFGDDRLQASAVAAGGRLMTSAPMIPGDHQVSLEYALPYERTEYEWSLRVPFPVDDVRVAAVGPGLVIEAGPSPVTLGEAGGLPVAAAALGALDEGATSTVRLTGLPPAPAGEAGAGMAGSLGTSWAATVATVTAVLGALTALAFPRRGRIAAARRREQRLRLERSAALDSVAELDILAGEGMIDDAGYRLRRAEALEAALRSTRALERGGTYS